MANRNSKANRATPWYFPLLAALEQGDGTAEDLLAILKGQGLQPTLSKVRICLMNAVRNNKIHVVDKIKRANAHIRVYRKGPKPVVTPAPPAGSTLPGFLRLKVPTIVPKGRIVRKMGKW